MSSLQTSFGIFAENLPEEILVLIQEVSDQIQIQKINSEPEETAYFSFDDEEGLSFHDPDLGPLHLDFVEDHIRYQRKGHRGKNELIVKALGLEKKTNLVVDATVGLAGDSLFLVQLGFSVIGFERSPIVYLLLQDAIRRWNLEKNDKAGSFQVIYQDAIQGLKSLKQEIRAVYVDPMFPEKKKSALPKKEMQIFKKWVGEDLDGEKLLRTALSTHAERVVVKRPLKAEALQSGVVHSFKGTTVRYDLYTPRG